MHYNFFLLRALCPHLEKKIKGLPLVACFSQNKDELVMQFSDATSSFIIRALLDPTFSCISFPDQFHRARKNSIDLFHDALGQRVQSVQVVSYERSFTVDLSGGYQFLFKMHGNRANMLLFHGGQVIDMFKHQLVADRSLTPAGLARSIDWSEANFRAHVHTLPAQYPVLGKMVWAYLNQEGFAQANVETKWQQFQACLARLSDPRFYVVEWQGQPVFSLLPLQPIIREYDHPVDALNDFCARYLSTSTFNRKKTAALAVLNKEIVKLQAWIVAAENRLLLLAADHHYQEWADVLMANLHRVPPGADLLEAENFYRGSETVRIPLRKDLSAQKNAEVFYRKEKNKSIEMKQLQASLADKKSALQDAHRKMNTLQAATHLRDLAPFFGSSGRSDQAKKSPFHVHHVAGFEVRVGKNAAANDLMLRAHVHKNDLWLHAKDAPGSHVIIKHRPGKQFPKTVIEHAASLAAGHSKRKTEGLVPVAYTLCKYVRKRKGDPPGAVVTEREETVLVPPAA